LDRLFDVHLDIFERKMCKHSFDLWVCSFLWAYETAVAVDDDDDDDHRHDYVLLSQLIVELNDELVVVVASYVVMTLAEVVMDDN